MDEMRVGVQGIMGGGERSVKGTWDLGCGARYEQLWVGEGEEGMRGRIKALVTSAVEKGESLVDALIEEVVWKGYEWGKCFALS